MRRATIITLACLLVLAAAGPAAAFQPVRKVWTVEMPTDSGVSDPGFTPGNTLTGVSGFSGTTTLQVREQSDDPFSGTTLLALGSFDYGFYTLAPMNLTPLSGVTPDLSGTTFTVRLYEAYGEDETAVGMAEMRPLVLDKDLSSGSSPFSVSFLSGAEAIWFEFLSSNTAWAGPEWRLVGREARPQDREYCPIILDEDYSAFSTSGVTLIYSGTTAIPVADGVRYIEVQPVGDDIYYTTDGSTTPSTTTRCLMDGDVILLRPYEWERFAFTPAGNSAGGLSIIQWSSDPK